MEENKESIEEKEKMVKLFKLKRLIKKLEECKGSGTSMVTLIMPPKKQIPEITNKLTEEQSSATNIKDRTNRQSVQDAITYTQSELKKYQKTPPNGLLIFAGKVLMPDGKGEEKIVISMEPPKPINTSLYKCDNSFHVEEVKILFENDLPFGFIIIDGHGTLMASLCGNNKEILNKFSVDLPKKHGRGGQSSIRFARLRLEKRNNYLTKVCEIAVQCFITNDRVNVRGLFLCGCGDLKSELRQHVRWDQRLNEKVLGFVDVSYGGENGLNQAIELSQESLLNVKFIQEKNVISQFFENISKESGEVIYGAKETIKMLEAGTIKLIVCFEFLEYLRVVLKNNESNEEKVEILKQGDISKEENFKEGDQTYRIVSHEPLVEWLAEHYSEYGAQIQFITDKSPEGFQFVKGFTGIGGFLRYKVENQDYVTENNVKEYVDDDEDFI